jgi:acetyl/propionyl-CoA carboxylase alpha subunit/acetyl-CoA carboxylase carboxyltransferase component
LTPGCHGAKVGVEFKRQGRDTTNEFPVTDPTRPIRRLAIVNRGEAAMRCIRTAKALRVHEQSDLQVIALYTDVDRDAPYVRHADFALQLAPRATPVASYLDHDLLLATLAQAGADAVWPGWGFVAESPEFVDRLEQAGIRFLGPSGDTMRRLGDKIASKVLAERLGVPVTPWSGRALENAEDALRWAEKLGLPLVLKASAGGGGRGIRMIEDLAKLPAQYQSASSEAIGAFGDGRLFLERMVRGGRHVEVQVVADRYGFVRAVGCRDCSVQRRHQKVIEEAPPASLSSELLEAMKGSAERLAREVRYAGVGTVEFLVEEGGTFFFMEMNPRLQVEHGITEEITGLDLVELQIRVGRGERLEGLAFQEHGYCIEARVCAEDPDQGFLPAPGRIARFDPASGPHLRVDAGVVQGSTVPSAFDSLIAKVLARGSTREQARSRLSTALRDFDLVISGGATNRGYLLEVLDAPEYRQGGVDTLWLDRWNAQRLGHAEHAAEALVLAAILAYRAAWQAERRDFFADTSAITPDKVPALEGRELDLEYRGESYRLRVFSVGSWRYRVHLDGRVVSARFGDLGPHTARVVICARYHRATYDITDAHVRVELEGCVHRFGRQTAGQVRAGAPSMVVSVDVAPGQRVEAGQHLGLLEAMKMEIAFSAPVAGLVSEVRVAKGQQVAAGDVLLVIDPKRDESASAHGGERLQLPIEVDPLSPLFTRANLGTGAGDLGVPDLRAADRAPAEQRSAAMAGINAEIARMMLGWDVFQPRFEKMLEHVEAPLPDGLSEDFRRELAEVRQGLIIFADCEQLFSHARRIEEGGTLGPSNNARLRVYLRRMRSAGAGIAEDFLDMLRAALRHYDIESLSYSEDIERAVLRMFAAQRDPTHRRRLVMAVLRRLIALVNSGIKLDDEPALRSALIRIAALRGDISNAVADTALEAHYRIYQGVEMQRQAESATRRLEGWLAAAESAGQTPSPPAEVLDDLAVAPMSVFARVEDWLRASDRWKQVIAVSAYVRRLYAPRRNEAHRSEAAGGRWIDRSRYDGKLVLATICSESDVDEALRGMIASAAARETLALELIVVGKQAPDAAACLTQARDALAGAPAAERVTLSLIGPEGGSHHTLAIDAAGRVETADLHGLHPETAARIDLGRYVNFELQRMWAPEDIYCFYARARQDRDDERLFVLGDVRSRPAAEGHDAELLEPIFERAFQEAARTMRLNLGIRDARRNLHWNRLVMHMSHPVRLDAMTAQRLARKLLSNIRHLGVEKTIVRLRLLSAERPQDPPREIEVVGSDVASSRLELTWRRPRRQPLVPASPYERKVAEARRRGLVYPYEIIRMLTSGDEARERVVEEAAERDRRPVLPVGAFEEYDLDPEATAPSAVSVSGRQPGLNESAIIFGIVSTKTAKVPEGMRRVLILSDPTRGMGALATPECDRVVAAIDLAEKLRLPVEWLPISSGARIAMDSGTENMDATARVVRRIVTFTQGGGFIHLIIAGVNIGAQSYWDALATMLMHTRGALIMTPEASMVLTGSVALAAAGSVSAEHEVEIGGHERVMGPNGQAQYFATDLLSAYQVLYSHYDYTYVVPGESAPRRNESTDPGDRDVREFAYGAIVDSTGQDFVRVGDVFDEEKNPGRKKPFAMRALMRAVIDWDGGHLERWGSHVGAETAIVWDTHLGGHPVCLIGIESQNVPRLGYRPSDGPEEWNGGTLFPQSSKKVARALNAASGNRPAVILANLSGFDGSPESMRKLQLEYGAEIARAVVNFQGPILFLVVSRYHGGAYVVFSRQLSASLRALAVEGSFASVIGGAPAATVVFSREVRARVAADPRIEALRAKLQDAPSAEERAAFDRLRQEVTIQKRAEVAAEFDSIHDVDRAKRVGSLEEIIPASTIRPRLIALLDEYCGR